MTENAQRFALAASGRDMEQARKRNPAEALKPLKKRGESHLSAARCVRRFLLCKTRRLKKDTAANLMKILHTT